MRNRLLGFTLIELMITVAIIAILATIAYPSYREHLQRSRRTVGESALTEIASKMEAYRFRNKTYTQNLGDLGYATSGNNAWNTFPTEASSTENYYRVQVVAATTDCPIASCFLLLAAPQNSQASDLWQFRLWSTGRKQSREGTSGSWGSGWANH
ncbi:type IV pilin protein [Thiorhodococcus fuscus]|uniref:Type IV pilin protein n=1 Tax=Thiorhodococcus fuscus TaxID=527200 RepID=A0ABW4Y3U7_9GAMM